MVKNKETLIIKIANHMLLHLWSNLNLLLMPSIKMMRGTLIDAKKPATNKDTKNSFQITFK